MDAHGRALHQAANPAARYEDSSADGAGGFLAQRALRFARLARGTMSAAQFIPRKCELFGVGVSATDYHELVSWCVSRAKSHRGGLVDLMPVHGLVLAARDAH